jgi:hypothetical protein
VDLSLVSKQLNDIIQNEPGNIDKIIPVFEVSCSSLQKLYQSLCGHFSDEKKKNKLQGYRIMRFKDVGRFASSGHYDLLQQIVRNIQLNGITLLDCSSHSPCLIHPCLSALKIVLPKLCEVNISNIDVDEMSHCVFLIRCPLLEKLTSNNIDKINLSGYWLKPSNNLNNTFFSTGEKDKMSDLSNHQEIFIFHHCCKSLERKIGRDKTTTTE